MEEALIPDNEFAIRLPAFEGPMDLLLYLIRRSEVDIYDIPIERVTEQYIEVLGSMESLDLEVAGEFFVMASTLMYIKSRMLLPKKDQGSNERRHRSSLGTRPAATGIPKVQRSCGRHTQTHPQQ